MRLRELNVDGLVGPTHNYAGLSHGNVASSTNRGRTSSPKRAALEGLAKMRLVRSLGVPQAVMPPQERPNVGALRRLGLTGSDAEVVERAGARDPLALAICSSASSMWTANAATVAPSPDTEDGRVHLTVANLLAKPHRALEAPGTFDALSALFPDRERFAVHRPIPGGPAFGDEGAANHTRLVSPERGGVHVFVYGREALRPKGTAPARFTARQTLEASRAVARLHALRPERAVFIQQSPEAIDAGVFHNDVTAVGHGSLLLMHERAYVDPEATRAALEDAVPGLQIHEVSARDVPLDDVVRSYLFNSQLVTPEGADAPTLVAPRECMEIASVEQAWRRWLDDGALSEVRFVDLRESMRNGGGPACLRLRVPLTDDELTAVSPSQVLDDALYARLVDWVERRYRDELRPADLKDPALLRESREALDELTSILGLGSFYAFQRTARAAA